MCVWGSTKLLTWQKASLIQVFEKQSTLWRRYFMWIKPQSMLVWETKFTWQKWLKKKRERETNKVNINIVVSDAKIPQLQMLDVTVYRAF